MLGKIIKGVAGAYTVTAENEENYICKAKGIFRKNGVTPLVGDRVEFEITDPADFEGNILKIYERRNELIRPACSNIDQVLLVFAAADPEPNYNLLDRFLILMMKQSVSVIVCFNKRDIVDNDRITTIIENYKASGIKVLFTSVLFNEGIEEIRKELKGKTTILAGPSGVGKSSMMNLLFPDAGMEIGELSEKIKRGKQTTRHTELIRIEEDTYLCDSPGFSSVYLSDMSSKELKEFFPEFNAYSGKCRFLSCNHINEPDCAVKEALDCGKISKSRFDNYCLLYEELKLREKR